MGFSVAMAPTLAPTLSAPPSAVLAEALNVSNYIVNIFFLSTTCKFLHALVKVKE